MRVRVGGLDRLRIHRRCLIDPQLGRIPPRLIHISLHLPRAILLHQSGPDRRRLVGRRPNATDPSAPSPRCTACTTSTVLRIVAHMRLGPSSCNRHAMAARRSSNWVTTRYATYTQMVADKTPRGPLVDVVSPTCITLEPTRSHQHLSVSWI